MSYYVVDTNVPIVANGCSEQADPDCVISCVDILSEIHNKGIFILDESKLILREYLDNLHPSGQPGLGDEFLQWVLKVQADTSYCKQVQITPCENDPNNFVEFPQDDLLTRFDKDDRKFVAVALGSKVEPEILNAVDPDWSEHFEALNEAGIKTRFLCPQHVCPCNK